MARPYCILSLDGGGVRGIIPARVMAALEERLQEHLGDPETRLADYFDLVAGTSTGGLLTCLALAPRPGQQGRPRSAREALELYLEHGDEIFRRGIWHTVKSGWGLIDEKYPAGGLESLLRRTFGELRLKELVRPCLIPAYHITRRRAWFFRQHAARKRPERDFLVRDVCRATSAAPSYFEAARIVSGSDLAHAFIDGGVFANNPALCAYTDARRFEGRTAADILMLSLGTGVVKKPYYYERARNWGQIRWLRPMLDIMMSGVADTVDFQLRQIFASVDADGRYLRLQADLPEDHPTLSPKLDEVSEGNVRALDQLGIELVDREGERLGAIARALAEAGPLSPRGA